MRFDGFKGAMAGYNGSRFDAVWHDSMLLIKTGEDDEKRVRTTSSGRDSRV
jgi:hypothetical protein